MRLALRIPILHNIQLFKFKIIYPINIFRVDGVTLL